MTIAIQHIDVNVTTDGSTISIGADAPLDRQFFRNVVQRRMSAGPIGNTSNASPSNVACALEMTANDTLTVRRGNISNEVKMMGEVWSYTGDSGGPNEFLVRGRYAITVGAGSQTGSQAVSGIVNRNKCIAFITGKTTSESSVSNYHEAMGIAYIDASDNVVFDRGHVGNASITAYITVVEFTGSNWAVHYWRGGWSNGDKTLVDDSRGNTGSTSTISSGWSSAMIIEGETQGDTSNDALEDTTFVFTAGGTNTAVNLTVDAGSANNNDTNVYVLENPNMTVARETATKGIPNNNTYDGSFTMPTLDLFSLSTSSLEFWALTDGSGTAFARGGLGAGLTSTTSFRTWCHRSGNTGIYKYGFVDLSLVPRPKIFTSPDIIAAEGLSVTITGENFQALQGSGKVYVTDDEISTDSDRVEQTIISWSNTEIQFTLDAGSYSSNQNLYIVVLDDNGVASNLITFYFGTLTYNEWVTSKNSPPDHYWTLNNTLVEIYNSAQNMTTTNSPIFVTVPGSAIRDTGETHCIRLQDSAGSGTQTLTCANSNFMNGQTETTRTMGGWIFLSERQDRFFCIYEEGGGVNNLAFLVGAGNILIAQLADTSDDNVHAYSDTRLSPGRWYHIMFRFDYTTTSRFELLVDGVVQQSTFGNPLVSTDLDAHSGDIRWGESNGTLEVFGTDVDFPGATEIFLSHWKTYTRYVPDEELRLQFILGVKSDTVISSDTPANMQTALNAFANSELPVSAVAVEIEGALADSDFTLSFDNITFRDDATFHIYYTGIGQLTAKNINGSNINETKCISINGPTVIVQTPSTITVSGFTNGSDITIIEHGTDTILDDANNQTSPYSLSVEVNSVDVIVQNLGYNYVRINDVDTSSNAFVPITQEVDRTYSNP
jgi:hypothetical protein